MTKQDPDLPPVTLTLEVDTRRFQQAMSRLSVAWGAFPASMRQAIVSAAAYQAAERARAAVERSPTRTGHLFSVSRAPYPHRTRWHGRRPKRRR